MRTRLIFLVKASSSQYFRIVVCFLHRFKGLLKFYISFEGRAVFWLWGTNLSLCHVTLTAPFSLPSVHRGCKGFDRQTMFQRFRAALRSRSQWWNLLGNRSTRLKTLVLWSCPGACHAMSSIVSGCLAKRTVHHQHSSFSRCRTKRKHAGGLENPSAMPPTA